MIALTELDVREHGRIVPWTDGLQVEQDLLLSLAMAAIFEDEFLKEHIAMRGGTALHKIHLAPPARYSEDIDLVAITERDETHIAAGLKRVLRPILGERVRSIPKDIVLISPDNRRRLSGPGLRAFLRIAERWHLNDDERARLLGMSDNDFTDQSRAAMAGETIGLPVAVLLRISAILGTYGALRTVFREPQRAASWIRAPSKAFGGEAALDIMLSEELAGLMRVRRYLEAELSGW